MILLFLKGEIMAVINTIITDRGVVYPDQYCRVERADVTKTTMNYVVGIYLNQQATENPPHRAENFSCDFDLFSDQNVWQQAYADLKLRWTEAVDA